MPDRAEAWELLCEYTKGDSLRKHALAVEAAMRACARRYNEGLADEDEWGIVGLLHDFDYEMFPTADQHPFTGSNILCGRGYSERIIRAILGHATYTGVPRDTDMARERDWFEFERRLKSRSDRWTGGAHRFHSISARSEN
jgi:predicted hydrolase (HD superfamily)